MGLGGIIRQRREELGLTQDQVSARVGISKPYLSNIETSRVKNPPTDGVILRLEKVLGFARGQLRRMAHLARTPLDVRAEHENLSAEVEKLRVVLAQLLAERPKAKPRRRAAGAKQASIDLDAVLRKIKKSKGNVEAPLVAGRAVPIINKVPAGYPHNFTDLDYPPSVADEYVRCPDVHDPQAFAARVVGDSMAPKYTEGDIVIFAPNTPAADGDDCFIRFADDWSTTFKQYRADEGGKIRLVARNEKYPPETYEPERVSGLWPAVMRVQQLG